MPSEEWKIKNFKQKWYAGETISVGIGQGAVATTPIQLARAIGAHYQRRRAGAAACGIPDRFPPNVIPAGSDCTDEMQHSARPAKLGDHHRRDGRRGQSPVGTAPQRAFAGYRFRRQDRQRADHLQRPESEAGRRRQASFKDNGWFVGVDTAAQSGDRGVLCCSRKASTDTSRPVPPRRSSRRTSRSSAGSRTKIAKGSGKLDIGAVWTTPDGDGGNQNDLHAGHFAVEVPGRNRPWRRPPQDWNEGNAQACRHGRRIAESGWCTDSGLFEDRSFCDDEQRTASGR